MSTLKGKNLLPRVSTLKGKNLLPRWSLRLKDKNLLPKGVKLFLLSFEMGSTLKCNFLPVSSLSPDSIISVISAFIFKGIQSSTAFNDFMSLSGKDRVVSVVKQ